MLSDVLFLQYSISFEELTETLLPEKIVLACSCLWVLFIYYWLLVLFSSGDHLRISCLIREKTELWFKGSVGLSTAEFYCLWNSGIRFSVKHHFYKIGAYILAVFGVLIGWVNSFVVQIKPPYSRWGISHFGECLGIYKKLNKLWISKHPGRRPSH